MRANKIRTMWFSVLSLLIGFSVSASVVPVTNGEVTWIGKKLTGSHTGTVALKEGKIFKNEAGEITGGEFVIDMTKINVQDIEDAEANQKLLNHLKSDDFFGVHKFKTAVLQVSQVEKTSAHRYKMKGDLTIKGVTHPITFQADLKNEGGQNIWTAGLKVDRTLYGIHFRSKQFFENLGDKVIYDDFELKIALHSAP